MFPIFIHLEKQNTSSGVHGQILNDGVLSFSIVSADK